MATSPMMEHYKAVKRQYPDCIVFYRLGDFYEMFYDDAKEASDILELTLTGKDCGEKDRAPMCGVPFHAADLYIAKLVSAGKKVAICEQLSEPSKDRKLVIRDVVKVVTAGTITNNELIDDKTNNFICCVYVDDGKSSISWSDITTGEFYTKRFFGKGYLTELFDSLIKVSPAEIIANKYGTDLMNKTPFVIQDILPKVSEFTESEFNLEIATGTLKKHFNILNLDVYNLSDDDVCIISSGALISYLKQTQMNALINISTIKVEEKNDYMELDHVAVRNLELVKTLRDGKKYGTFLWLLDKTKTSMGARKLQSWVLSPLNQIEKIKYRQNAVECFYNNTLIRQSIYDLLSSVKDIERITGKISNGNLTPHDCKALQESLEVLPRIKFQLSGINDAFLQDIIANIVDFDALVSLIDSAIIDEKTVSDSKGLFKYIKAGYNAELDELRDLAVNGKQKITRIESAERERTGIKNLKIGYNKVFGYYIEVTNSFKDKIPFEYQRKQTLMGAERFVTQEIKDLEIKILSAQESADSLESKLYVGIKNELTNYVEVLKKASNSIADLDVLISLSMVARNNSYVKPTITEDKTLKIVQGRHPVVETISGQRFIPNDAVLDNNENRSMIITGPNMAGKSTYMRQVALITILAHIGSFVPATSATIPITDKIFTRIGASDSLISDRSTFMVEMSETADIVKNATENSLIILDEIGRGTSTYDGLSIAWSVIEYITSTIKARTMFATHYHELTDLEGKIDGIKNYKVTVKETADGISFLRQIVRGGANRSFGIEVAELAGVDKVVIDRAKTILKLIEKSNSNFNINSNRIIEKESKQLSEVERILSDIDINNLTPIQAFNTLSDLCEKVKENIDE